MLKKLSVKFNNPVLDNGAVVGEWIKLSFNASDFLMEKITKEQEETINWILKRTLADIEDTF